MTNENSTNGINANRLLWAGFMAILAAGVGFGIRGGLLATWGAEFGFTSQQLGAITGAGFTGFCFGIIIGGVIVDKVGYPKLVFAAFLFHALSAFITFAASKGQAIETAYQFLYWGTFIFAVANGTLEAVANPLVSTLFPKKRTHYLNILHASWPAGLVLGGMAGWFLSDMLSWKLLLGLFLIPTVVYGLMFMGQKMPKSEASDKGLSVGEMFKDVGLLGGIIVCWLLALFFINALGFSSGTGVSIGIGLLLIVMMITHTHGSRGETIVSFGAIMLFVLFITHALVGAVELGTDGWIQNITGNILTPTEGKILFVFTSFVMFALRFCADFIERKLGLSPLGILLVCSILACIGLNLASGITTFTGALLALGVYAVGKTFFWPTMLAVVGDRYPRSGAIAMSIMGGIGMMSAGLLGSTGLGYAKDRFSADALKKNEAVYAEYKSEQSSSFLFFEEANGLDGKKFGQISGKLNSARDIIAKGKVDDLDQGKLAEMSDDQKKETQNNHSANKALEKQLSELGVLKSGNPKDALKALSPNEKTVHEASIVGDRNTLVADSFIPAIMAIIYLLLILYFKGIGGYKPITIEEQK